MDSVEEAGTAASLTSSLCGADQLRNVSVNNVRSEVVHLVVGHPSNTAVWQTRCGFRYGV